MSKISMSNVLTAEVPENSLSTGWRLTPRQLHLVLISSKGGWAFEVFWTYDCITQEPDVRSWSNFACEALFCH